MAGQYQGELDGSWERSAPGDHGKLAELDAESFSSDYTVKAPDGGDILGFDGIDELELEVTDIAVFVGTYSGDQVVVDASRMETASGSRSGSNRKERNWRSKQREENG